MSSINAELHDGWTHIEGQGLVRVVLTDSLRTGFALMTRIGQLAEPLDYYPEITLASHKVTITVATREATKAHQLAKAIDSLLANDA